MVHPMVMLHGAVWLAGLDISLKASCPYIQKHFDLSDDVCHRAPEALSLGSSNPTPFPKTEQSSSEIISSLVGNLVWAVIGAWLWKTRITDKKIADQETTLERGLETCPDDLKFQGRSQGSWKYGLFDCFGDMNYCFHGCCCYICMASDLFAVNTSKGYWGTWFILYLPILLSAFVQLLAKTMHMIATISTAAQASVFLLNIIIAMALTGPTNDLRKRLGGGEDSMEFVKWWCCPTCSVIQKQRQVDEIRQDMLVGCMSVNTNAKAREVGEAFIVDVKEPLIAV